MNFWKELGDICEFVAERRAYMVYLVRASDRRTNHHPRLDVYAAIDAARAFGR